MIRVIVLLVVGMQDTVLASISCDTNTYGNRQLIREVVSQFHWNEGAWIDSIRVPCDIAESTKRTILSKSNKQWRQLFLDGSDEAASALGLSYMYGIGSTHDEELGLLFLKSAAGSGRANSALHLAVANWCGIGNLTEDYIEALKWYKLADKLDDEGKFSFDLSRMYLMAAQQAVVRKDYSKAIELHKESLAYGNTISAVHLAAFYALGKGVEESISKAVEHLESLGVDELQKYSEQYGDRPISKSLVAKIVVTDLAIGGTGYSSVVRPGDKCED